MQLVRRCSVINNNSVYIPQIDGKDLWISNYSGNGSTEYSLTNKKGEPNLKRYKATLDYSLDLIQLRDVYWRAYRNAKFSFTEKNKEYTNSVINVTFDYSVREFNRIGKDIYVRYGNSISNVDISDGMPNGITKYGDDVIAVQVEKKSPSPAYGLNLPKYFHYQNRAYHINQNVRTVATVADIRKKLYAEGFFCNGVKYVRWKRSSGSARVGKCLFIDERLYRRFHSWEMCGLDIRRGEKVDLAAIESYISLTSSSIIDTIELKPQNILVVDDYDSIFEDDVINVVEEGGRLVAREERATITNSIFDGESIIDISAMGKYSSKGMVLLRNRFFKSCCFNGNIQKWFFDHKITDVSQLNGSTIATSVSDIKLITTPSSIKYLKFSTLEQWFENIDDTFGVVKYEKPPHFLDGNLVQTHYQLINSIQLSKSEMQKLLQPTFHFMDLIKTHPEVLRHWIKFKIEDEFEVTPVKSKTDVIYKMMSVNEDFCKTKLYYDFRTDFLKSFSKDLKCGHILVNGNYSTLCGNPVELLMCSIGTFDGTPVMEHNCVHSERFEWGAKLLGSRSPHITMSNILLTENRRNSMISRYMNPTNEIVYVNAIDENIQQRLAGCDYDSDSQFLTDDPILVGAATRNNNKFKVAVCSVGGSKKARKYTTDDQSDLDIKTSKNLIGDIVNMSQELNSRIWDIINGGNSHGDEHNVDKLYLSVCKLSVASGIEIDKAKKEFVIDNARELADIRAAHRLSDANKSIKPNFFAHISRQKGYYNPRKKAYIKHRTSMDYLQQCVNSYRLNKNGRPQKIEFLPFSAVVAGESFSYENVSDIQIHTLIADADHYKTKVDSVFADKSLSKDEQHSIYSEICAAFIEKVRAEAFTQDTMIAILYTIEKEENRKYRRLLFNALFGHPSTSFYELIKKSKGEIPFIEEKVGGEIDLYGHKFSPKLTFLTPKTAK